MMATPSLQPVINHVRGMAFRDELAKLPDGQLLERYLAGQDEAAFEALVKRHGPMVLATCCRVLANRQDAEDAFQATFLVLVRKAVGIRPREKVGSWLYGVAYKAALKARTSAARRGTREKQMTELPEPIRVEKMSMWDDLVPLLDRELTELPDKFRLPIVLCDLEGKTRKEAARQLGWPEGTVAGRIAQGRAMLAKRLSRHGLPVSAGVLAALLAENSASASLPAALATSTVRVASLLSVPQAALTGVISAQAASLADGVLKSMLLSKLKLMGMATVAVAVLTLGGAMLASGQAASDMASFEDARADPGRNNAAPEEDRQAPEPGKKKVADGAGDHAQLTEAERELQRLQGTWQKTTMEHDGKPNVRFANVEPFYTFQGDQFAITDYEGRTVRKGSFKANPDEHTLDLIIADGTDKGTTEQLRYEFKDNWLHLAVNLVAKKRPPEMKTTPGSGIGIYHFRRVDPPAKEDKKWSARLGTLDWRHGEAVECAALSPDGKRLATAGATLLHIFDTNNGRILHTLRGHSRAVKSLTFSPDNRTLLSSSLDGSLREWNADNGEQRRILVQGVRDVHQAAFSPDGATVAVGVDANPEHYLVLLNAQSGKEGARLAIDTYQLVFSPDGRYLATTGTFDRRAFLVEVATRRKVCELTSTGALVNSIAFTPDSRTLVADPGYEEAAKGRTLAFWEVASGKLRHKLAVPNTSRTKTPLVFSADGKTLHSGSDSINVETGLPVPPPSTFAGGAVATTPDGRLLATQHQQSGVISIYDRTSGEDMTPGLGHKGAVMVVVPLGDGKEVVTFGNDQLRAVWKVTARGYGEATTTVATNISEFSLAADGRVVAISTRENELVLYDVASGAVRKHLKSTRRAHQGIVSLSRDGGLLAVTRFRRSGPDDEQQWRVELVNTSKDELVSTIGLDLRKPTGAAFSPDAKTLALGTAEGKLQLLEVANGQSIGTGVFAPQAKAESLASIEHLRFSPDGKSLVSADKAGNVIFWDLATGKERRRLAKRFGPVQFFPDGKLFASIDDQQAIRLCDTKTGEDCGRFAGHSGPIRSLAFSTDGTRLYSGSDDTTALAWDVK